MAENGANGTLRAYVPLIITIVISVAPVLVISGRLINRVDNLEQRIEGLQSDMRQRFAELVEMYNTRTLSRDRQAEAFEARVRALAELLVAQQRDFVAMAGTDSRQDETLKQAFVRMDRLFDRLNDLDREVRPYSRREPDRGREEQ